MPEIRAASLPQIVKGRGGRVVFIDNDALDIAKDLLKIHPSLRLAFNEVAEYFVVYQVDDQGNESIVTTSLEADARLLERVRKVVSPQYNLAEELDRMNDKADAESEYRFSQKTGEIAERLAHAIRRDTQTKNKIIVPRSVDGDNT